MLAWLIGFPALVLAGEVDDRFGALGTISGLLLIGMAVRAVTSDRDWERFVASQRRGRFGHPRGRAARLWFAGLTFLIGLGWTLAGLLGILAVFGLYDFPE